MVRTSWYNRNTKVLRVVAVRIVHKISKLIRMSLELKKKKIKMRRM